MLGCISYRVCAREEGNGMDGCGATFQVVPADELEMPEVRFTIIMSTTMYVAICVILYIINITFHRISHFRKWKYYKMIFFLHRYQSYQTIRFETTDPLSDLSHRAWRQCAGENPAGGK